MGRSRKWRRERQGNTCLPQILWISLRDTRLTRRFSPSRISIQFSSFSQTSEVKEHPWVSRITRTSEALRIASSVSNKNIMPGWSIRFRKLNSWTLKFHESQEEFQIKDHLERDFKTVSIDGMLEGWRQTNLFQWKELDANRKSEKPTRLCVEFNQLLR